MKLGRTVPMRVGCEPDVFSSWRRVYCYLARPGICKAIKRQYNKRVRRSATMQIIHEANDYQG